MDERAEDLRGLLLVETAAAQDEDLRAKQQYFRESRWAPLLSDLGGVWCAPMCARLFMATLAAETLEVPQRDIVPLEQHGGAPVGGDVRPRDLWKAAGVAGLPEQTSERFKRGVAEAVSHKEDRLATKAAQDAVRLERRQLRGVSEFAVNEGSHSASPRPLEDASST